MCKGGEDLPVTHTTHTFTKCLGKRQSKAMGDVCEGGGSMEATRHNPHT